MTFQGVMFRVFFFILFLSRTNVCSVNCFFYFNTQIVSIPNIQFPYSLFIRKPSSYAVLFDTKSFFFILKEIPLHNDREVASEFSYISPWFVMYNGVKLALSFWTKVGRWNGLFLFYTSGSGYYFQNGSQLVNSCKFVFPLVC